MRIRSRHLHRVALLLAVGLFGFTSFAHAYTVTFRSGNGPVGGPDPLVTYYDLAAQCGLGFPAPFGPAEFAAASAGPQALVMSSPHGAWAASLPCDPQARWVGRDNFGAPMSALYAIDVPLEDRCCYQRVTLTFCWTTDDVLGDAVNPPGLYVNGQPVPVITGGNYATETVITADITGLVKCGSNQITIHNRDLGCAVSGVMFSGTIDAIECVTPTEISSWGSVKAIYR